jgi:pimeloyl-ACP methyl ester carboxylesterase
MSELAAAHANALDELFAAPIDLMGVSTGGAIALQLAVDRSKTLHCLIVAGAAGSLGESGRCRLEEYGRLISQGKSGARLLASVLAGPMLRWPATLMLWLEEWMERDLDPSDMLATIHAECGFNVYASLSEITAPTLVIAGEDDRAFSPEQFRATADGIPNAKLVLYRNRGHVTAMFDPCFGRDVTAFLND